MCFVCFAVSGFDSGDIFVVHFPLSSLFVSGEDAMFSIECLGESKISRLLLLKELSSKRSVLLKISVGVVFAILISTGLITADEFSTYVFCSVVPLYPEIIQEICI